MTSHIQSLSKGPNLSQLLSINSGVILMGKSLKKFRVLGGLFQELETKTKYISYCTTITLSEVLHMEMRKSHSGSILKVKNQQDLVALWILKQHSRS